MSEYYAVERTGSSLQHYGVKGMKWGVRKAIEKKKQCKACQALRESRSEVK